MNLWKPISFLCVCLILTGCSTRLEAGDGPQEAETFFENNIRPLLVNRCVRCHGPKKSESGLRLNSRESILKGGENGPAILTGEPQNSLLMKAIRHQDGLEMPPDEQLNDREIAAFERWIRDGAAWPRGISLGGTSAKIRSGPITDAERAFWSFQPIADPRPPASDEYPHATEIDRFVARTLRAANLKATAPATKHDLIRRATFDLTGLPPTPEEDQAFVDDDSPTAFAQVIDRLLASRAYGERWGRHWLDVVRYADTAGETADYPTPLAYKYRNWVIDALNDDMPYDEFVREQIAGDIIARQSPDLSPEEFKHKYEATGFIAISRRFGFDVENYHHLTIQDTIDVVGQSMLGLTLGCARCHDHKFDPVNMTDFYAWYGIFQSTRYSFPGSEEKKRPYDSFPALPAQVVSERQTQFDQRVAELETKIAKFESELKSLSESSPDDTASKEALQKRQAELAGERDALKRAGPFSQNELIYGAIDNSTPVNAHIQIRGEPTRPGEEAPRRNLDILGGEPVPADAGSGRLQLADWLTSDENPLFARVMVNRIWQQHFGRGLVGTENDFGARGERPTHPELLDWLASRFKESNYSIKAMHRLIMNTAAYQRSSEYDITAAERDPDARLLWRFNRRRLSAEEIRDTMLFVSGNLDSTRGAGHPFPPVETWGFTQHTPFYAVYPTNRRSVYLMQQRLKRHPFLGLFDGADTNVSTARRELTTVPTQALFLMNNEFVHEQATAFARRISSDAPEAPVRVERAYRLAFGRAATEDELSEAADFLEAYRQAAAGADVAEPDRERVAWEAFARTILTRNEFLFVD